jgi:uncharacterized protein YecE (DUF72 family)
MEIWIGTSGYVYPDWVGDFYPPGTPSARMLPFYARHFPLVELNYTFYRLPAPGDLIKLAGRTPPGFQMIVKLHQSLSHDLDLNQAATFAAAVRPLQQEQRLRSLLCQFPQRFHDTPANRDWLADLAGRFAAYPLAVEFRHRSWHRPDIPEWLQAHGLHLVSVDVPPLPGLYPAGLVQSSRLLYVRFHSRRAAAWYQDDKVRYDYDYSDEELIEWLEALAARRGLAECALLLFNNCYRGQAARNARRLQELIPRFGAAFRVVSPFGTAEAAEEQGSLF